MTIIELNNTQLGLNASALNATVASLPIATNTILGYALQVNVTGTPTGSFLLQASVDPSIPPFTNGLQPTNWTTVLNSPVTVSAAGNIYWNISAVEGNWVQLLYTSTLVETGSITAVADVSGSLNNTYFLINGGNNVNWYVWFNINSAGTDPALPGRTGIAVAAATNASANTLGGDIRTALASVTSVGTIGGSTDVATFDQVSAQFHGNLVDGPSAHATGFTLSYTSSNAVIASANMTLKGV